MEIQQVNRTDADKVFCVALNADADSITTGYGAVWCMGANSFDGATVMKSTSAAALPLLATQVSFAGVADKDIAPNTRGRIQIWGFANSVFISNIGSSATLAAGSPLVPGIARGGLFSAAPTYANSGFKYILCSNDLVAVSASGWVSGIIRGGF